MTVILTVEDEFLTSEYLGDILEDAGYEVVATYNADEAIAILEERKDIRIIITDIQLPGSMDGLKLAAAVRGRWPAIKFILTTGRRRPGDDQMPERSQFVPKPYQPNGILAAVRFFPAVRRSRHQRRDARMGLSKSTLYGVSRMALLSLSLPIIDLGTAAI
jgi:CheY-like chemotaxis protein